MAIRSVLVCTLSLICGLSSAQESRVHLPPGELPRGMAPHEWELVPEYQATRAADARGISTPPPLPVRTMAEWEEVETLCITWRSYPIILKQIVRHAKEHAEVLIICASTGTNSQASVASYLLANNAGGPPLPDLDNITFLTAPSNSIWIRDYGPEAMYFNEVDSLVLLDWIYNRPRPSDDALSDVIGTLKNIAVFSTIQAPNDLVHTGGNFMADGFGTGFSSKLVDMENGPQGQFNQTNKTPAQVDALMATWMGIDPYIKMDELPFDNISHIDMHMKLLDEERLLVGEFPAGVSDGPQIEANIAYVQENFTSVFGTPYEIVRIPMVPSPGSNPVYPPQGYYRTYANAIFINRLIIVPTYREQYDTTGLRIWREAMPGYTVVGIDCDNSDANIISASGAIHCITKTIGVRDPLLVRHQRLRDTDDAVTPRTVEAYVRHRSGLSSVQLRWTTDTTAGFQSVAMLPMGGHFWTAQLPAQPAGTQVFYYIHAVSNNGRTMHRPLPGPQGPWRYRVLPGGSPALPLALRVLLDGPYEEAGGLMRDDLRSASLIPLAEPYSGMGSTMQGGEGAATSAAVLSTTGPDAVVDWVLVELRDAADPSAIIRTRTGLVQRDGDVTGPDGVSPLYFDTAPGSYHVAVRHRNHLGCMTAVPVAMGTGITPVDLADPTTLTWGSGSRRTAGGVALLWAGDVNADGILLYTGLDNDRDLLLQAIGGTVPTIQITGQYRAEDVNLDGAVRYTGEANDRDRILQNIGGVVPTASRLEQLP